MRQAVNLEYKEVDGILYPKIEISTDKEADKKPLGKYGQMRMNFLRKNHPNQYSLLLARGELMSKMHQTNEKAHQRLELITEQMLKTDPIPDQKNTMESFHHREKIRQTAEEIVLHEIVYR